MIQYRSYYIAQAAQGFIVFDGDHMSITVERTLAKAKHFINCLLDSVVSTTTIEDVNDLI